MKEESDGYASRHIALFNWVLLYTTTFFALSFATLLFPEKLVWWLNFVVAVAAVIHVLSSLRHDRRSLPLDDDDAVFLKVMYGGRIRECPRERFIEEDVHIRQP